LEGQLPKPWFDVIQLRYQELVGYRYRNNNYHHLVSCRLFAEPAAITHQIPSFHYNLRTVIGVHLISEHNPSTFKVPAGMATKFKDWALRYVLADEDTVRNEIAAEAARGSSPYDLAHLVTHCAHHTG
jgi:hypothetical protein